MSPIFQNDSPHTAATILFASQGVAAMRKALSCDRPAGRFMVSCRRAIKGELLSARTPGKMGHSPSRPESGCGRMSSAWTRAALAIAFATRSRLVGPALFGQRAAFPQGRTTKCLQPPVFF